MSILPSKSNELEVDPDGTIEKVAVSMKGQVCKDAGLKNSQYPEIEGRLYDNLCELPRSQTRDEVRKLALNIAETIDDKEFMPSVSWLDNFMRRFCLSRQKLLNKSKISIKIKGSNKSKKALIQSKPIPEKPATSESSDVHCLEKSKSSLSTETALENKVADDLPNVSNGTSSQTELISEDNVDCSPTIPNLKEDSLIKPPCAEVDSTNHSESDAETDLQDNVNTKTCDSEKNGKNSKTNSDIDASYENSSEEDEKKGTGSSDSSRKKSELSRRKKKRVQTKSSQSSSESDDEKNTSSSNDTGTNENGLIRKQMEVKYSKKEDSYYEENLTTLKNSFDCKLTTCTACYEHINHLIPSQVYTHRVLGVLLCRNCFKFYGKGNFKKDSEGYDEYCRWCANGGDLLLCDTCTNGFCKKCIKRNLGRTVVRDIIKAKSWNCCVCDLSSLTEVRAKHRLLLSTFSKQSSKLERAERNSIKYTRIRKSFKSRKIHKLRRKSSSHWFSKCLDEVADVLLACTNQVMKLEDLYGRSNSDQEQLTRRLLRLSREAQEHFLNIEKTIKDSSEATAQENLSSKEVNSSEAKNNSSERKKNPSKTVKKQQKPKNESSSEEEQVKAPIPNICSSSKTKKDDKKKLSLWSDEEKDGNSDGGTSNDGGKVSESDGETSNGSCKKKDLAMLSQNSKADAPALPNNDSDASAPPNNDSDGSAPPNNDSDGSAPPNNDSDGSTDIEDLLAKKVEKTSIEPKPSTPPLSPILFKKNKSVCESDSDIESLLDDSKLSSKKLKKNKNRRHSLGDEDLKLSSREPKSKNSAAKKALLDSDSSSDECKLSSKINKTKKISKGLFQDTDEESDCTENNDAKSDLLNSDSNSILRKNKRKKRAKKGQKKKKISAPSSHIKHKPVPKSVMLRNEQKQLKSKVTVDIKKLSPEMLNSLKKIGYVHLSDSASEDSSSCSETEIENLLNFDLEKVASKRSRTPTEDEDEDEENDKVEEKKPTKSTTKMTKKKEKAEGLLDVLLDDNDESKQEDEMEDTDEDKNESTVEDKAKKSLLESSDEDHQEGEEEDEELESGDNDADDSKEARKQRIKYEKKKLDEEMKMLDKKSDKDSSEEEDMKKKKIKKKKKSSLRFSTSEDEDDDDSDDETYRKKRMFVDSDSDDGKSKRTQKTLFSSSPEEISSEDEEEEEKKKRKSKRKRIRRPASSSEEGNSGEKEEKESPKKKIRKIIRDEDLLESTKSATQQEEERTIRLKERQTLYNKIFEIDVEKDQKNFSKVVLDFDPDSKKELISVNEKLVSYLKPHQAEGIKFMWDASVESLSRLQDGKIGGGCILAHCMGLGKTLQVITFVHTLLTNKKSSKNISRVMVVCPVNTVYNWVQEFKNWLKGKLLSFDVIELISAKSLSVRSFKLEDWYKEGGVCIIGYDMFRNLSNINNKKYKGHMKSIFSKSLLDPGPDIIICDEGHILKNEKTALSISINKVKTLRRIVLTGTPLQNNLTEYHCMIQFVKPNLLGSKKEFLNRFVNPITAGQTIDANPRDVRRMKRRAHILHDLLKGCVQRFDYSVLKPFLPPKYEYVVSVQLSEIQCKLYEYYLKNLAQGGPKKSGAGHGLFVDFQNLGRIWSHPAVLYLAQERKELMNMDLEDLEEGDEEDRAFIDDDCSTTSDDSDTERPSKKEKSDEEEKKTENVEPEVEKSFEGLTSEGKVRPDWWRKVLEDFVDEEGDVDEILNRINISGKIFLLMLILRKCSAIGDKVLLFSQSILALNMIENFLKMVDDREIELPKLDENEADPVLYTQWKLDRDYLRLDGSTSADTRKDQCKQFNNADNERCRLFLISTKAGGVGINLVGANRVIIFDASWNPSHDTQSIFRVYRFGQKKPCYIYRFIAQGTMEERIYSRQVTKISTSLRVVDEHQIKRYFNMDELSELYKFTPSDVDDRPTPNVPEDRLLAEMLIHHKKWIVGYHEQDSLLENQTDEGLTEEERKAAWEDFENEKKGLSLPKPGVQNMSGPLIPFNVNSLIQGIMQRNPGIKKDQYSQELLLGAQQSQAAHLKQYQLLQAAMFEMKNPMIGGEIRRQVPFSDNPDMQKILEFQAQQHYDSAQRADRFVSQLKVQLGHNLPSANLLMAAGLMRGQPSNMNNAQAILNNVAINYKNRTIARPPNPVSGGASKSTPSVDQSASTSTDKSNEKAVVVTLE